MRRFAPFDLGWATFKPKKERPPILGWNIQMTRNDPYEIAPMAFVKQAPNPGLLALSLVEEAARGLGPFARIFFGLRLARRLLLAPFVLRPMRGPKQIPVHKLDAHLRRDIGLPEEAQRERPQLYPPPLF